MERVSISPRNNWQAAVEKLGFGFHTTDLPYWDESVYYRFSLTELEGIERATSLLWDMCLKAVQHIIDNRLYYRFAIPEKFIPYIEASWEQDAPAIYGRFDFSYKNGQIKLLEFNADTPTSLFEAGIVQWFWLQDFDASRDQFNSVHEKLIAYWKYLNKYLHPGNLHFTCMKETLEDLTNTEYMRDCAMQAGLETKLVYTEDIGWDSVNKFFVDMEEEPIKNIFKLYPWEFLMKDAFGDNILEDTQEAYWIEPAWKMILSNKAILPILYQLFPASPYILPAYFDDGILKDNFVKKPILSREGANITLVKNNNVMAHTDGAYGQEGFIYQQLCELPVFNGKYPLIGSWIIGQEPAGIGIREADDLITGNTSRFVPHLIQ
jgi:glutathionylspermidine synthase